MGIMSILWTLAILRAGVNGVMGCNNIIAKQPQSGDEWQYP